MSKTMTSLSKGDRVKIIKGPFNGKVAELKRYLRAVKGWFVWIDGLTEFVWEDEIGKKTALHTKQPN